MNVRIAMWSGPRNISTAMMRSFGSRADTSVSDEPFYGAFLKATGADHPMAGAIIADMDCDWRSVMRTLNGPVPEGRPIWYQKHMSHHMEGPVGPADFEGFAHAFLIRAPERMIASYLEKRERVTLRDLGLERQLVFFEAECDRIGHPPPVIDAADIAASPEPALRRLCTALGIDWDPAMLSWQRGRRATDGIWAAHWYARAEASTGFEAPANMAEPALDDDGKRLADACRPLYERLAAFRLN